MYSLLIVEDEKIEMELLEQYVPWHEMNIKIVGTARNGKEALLKLETCRPDIVLTDVRMPIMDGLEFARQVRQNNKEIKIVFLSGHNEFQYIKAALSIEAVGYLLKPIDMKELRSLMEIVKSKCNEDAILRLNLDAAIERLMAKWLMEKDEMQRQKWSAQLFTLASPLPAHAVYRVAYITLDNDPNSSRNRGYSRSPLIAELQTAVGVAADYVMGVELEEKAIGLVLMSQGDNSQLARKRYWEALITSLPAPFDSSNLTIALSDKGEDVEDLPVLYRMAKERNAWKFHLGTGKVITAEDSLETTAVDMKPELVAAKLCRAITLTDEQNMKTVIADFTNKLKQGRIRKNLIISNMLTLLNEVESQFSGLLVNSAGNMLFMNHWEKLSLLPTIDSLEEYISGVCREIIVIIQSKGDNPSLQLLHKITELIQLRFSTPLTVEDIAKEVYLSPNYVRTLFKEATGVTILEAITRYRMQQAIELLGNKQLKIHEISHSVGYENVSYFCSVFLKHKGCTPNQYRKKILT